MVYLALTHRSLQDFEFCRPAKCQLWVVKDVLADGELQSLFASQVNVTVLSQGIDVGDWQEVEVALEAIREHHPGETIWVGV